MSAREEAARPDNAGRYRGRIRAAGLIVLLVWFAVAVSDAAGARSFATPEDAVKALIAAAKASSIEELQKIFGSDGEGLTSTSDPATARRNREVFIIAVNERWRLVDEGKGKTLVIGNEDWPFPVPLVKAGTGWQFDTAAGREEIIARRIGRNELSAIDTCRAYVTAQQRYAMQAHDGKPAGLYAAKFNSDPGQQNGLYWPTARGQKRSPLGDLLAQAAADGRTAGANPNQPSPYEGYYFKILTGQGAAAPGGAKNYVVNGAMSGGFALVAWPAQYNGTGVMTFLVGQDGIVHEKDLGEGTDAAARKMTTHNPDATWHRVQ